VANSNIVVVLVRVDNYLMQFSFSALEGIGETPNGQAILDLAVEKLTEAASGS
jgi:hypothetical protein